MYINRRFAELKAAEIEQNILKEKFDTSLEKYRSAFDRERKYIDSQKIQQSTPYLDELWKKYCEFQKPQVSPSTYAKDFKRYGNHIANLPTRALEEASSIRNWLLKYKSVDTVIRCLT